MTEALFSLWMAFLAIIRLRFSCQTNTRRHSFFPWRNFAYHKLPFGLKNVDVTFQRAMSYSFHDIKHVVEPYVDDLPTHSKQRDIHVTHLRAVFLQFHHFNIRLNPHKCGFCVEVGQILGFIHGDFT